jgi:hypothetical protein
MNENDVLALPVSFVGQLDITELQEFHAHPPLLVVVRQTKLASGSADEYRYYDVMKSRMMSATMAGSVL